MDLLLKEQCLTNIEYIAASHRQFRDHLQDFSLVKNARSTGTVLAFEIISGSDGYLNTVSAETTAWFLKRGIYIRPLGNTVYLMPPYCITNAQLQELYDGLIGFLRR
jgi:adenosylmethionine-8-amino-7-oxononanoate aminotransferase